jgi:hypothetical protein
VTHVSHGSQIVTNEEETYPGPLLKVFQEVQQLRSNRDVLRRYRFVKDNEFWITGQSPGNGYSLSLPTTEFVRIFPGVAWIKPYRL